MLIILFFGSDNSMESKWEEKKFSRFLSENKFIEGENEILSFFIYVVVVVYFLLKDIK